MAKAMKRRRARDDGYYPELPFSVVVVVNEQGSTPYELPAELTTRAPKPRSSAHSSASGDAGIAPSGRNKIDAPER